jgi:hypothetical protein
MADSTINSEPCCGRGCSRSSATRGV